MKSEKANKTEKVFMTGIFALLLLMAAGFLAYSFTGDKVAAEVALAAMLTGMAWFGAFFLMEPKKRKQHEKEKQARAQAHAGRGEARHGASVGSPLGGGTAQGDKEARTGRGQPRGVGGPGPVPSGRNGKEK